MMKEETYTCECGKSFTKFSEMTGYQSRCKVHQKLLHDKKEARRLPNGMFKCENPDCDKEHDGSYGSGRFCSIECKRHYIAIHHKAKYGTWKCHICNLIFDTRRQRNKHNQQYHYTGKPGNKPGHAWNHGLTKETCPSIANAAPKISVGIRKAIAEGRCIGRGATPEKEALRRQRMSVSALNRTTPSVCKRTEPYTRKDGTIVNLDSSYERTIAKILDEHNIDWIRPKPLDWYSKDGVKHHYFPDFYLTKYDIYLDPKNDYCFKVQAEKISYVKEHYTNCIFMTKDQLTWEYIEKILESQSSPVKTPHC